MEVYRYTKKELRQQFLKEREVRSKRFIVSKSLIISKKLLNFLRTKRAINITSYNSFNNEVIINNLAINRNFNLFFTKIDKDVLYIVKSKYFKKHKFGIREPFCGTLIFKKSVDCFLVPAVVFDKSGYRIGYGMGFYDKLLKDSKALKIGIAFDFQLLKQDYIDKEEFDVPVDYIITEKKIISCRRIKNDNIT